MEMSVPLPPAIDGKDLFLIVLAHGHSNGGSRLKIRELRFFAITTIRSNLCGACLYFHSLSNYAVLASMLQRIHKSLKRSFANLPSK